MKKISTLLLLILPNLIFGQWQKEDRLLLDENLPKIYYSLDSAFVNPSIVQILDLSGMNLADLPDSLIKLENLKELYLGQRWTSMHSAATNNFKRIPQIVFKLSALEVLDVSQNKIKSIPDEIGNLKNLKILDLLGNPITKISEEIGELEKLETIDLSYTQTKTLPKEFSQLKHLKNLYLLRTNLRSLDFGISNLNSLNFISMTGEVKFDLNNFMQEIIDLPNLKILELPAVEIIPPIISESQSIEEIALFENKIVDDDQFYRTIAGIKNLKSLKLSYRSDEYYTLKKVSSEIGKLYKLEYLQLYYPGGVELPSSVGELINLKSYWDARSIKSGRQYLPAACVVLGE